MESQKIQNNPTLFTHFTKHLTHPIRTIQPHLISIWTKFRACFRVESDIFGVTRRKDKGVSPKKSKFRW